MLYLFVRFACALPKRIACVLIRFSPLCCLIPYLPYTQARVESFEEEPRTVLHTAAIPVRSEVGQVVEKLINKVTIRRVQFNTIKSSLFC